MHTPAYALYFSFPISNQYECRASAAFAYVIHNAFTNADTLIIGNRAISVKTAHQKIRHNIYQSVEVAIGKLIKIIRDRKAERKLLQISSLLLSYFHVVFFHTSSVSSNQSTNL